MGIHTDIYIYLYTSTANGHFQSLSIALLNYQRVSWSIFGHSAWHMAKRSPVKAKAPNDRHTWIAGSILLVPLAWAAWQAVTYLGSFYLYTCTVCIHAHKYNIYIYIYINKFTEHDQWLLCLHSGKQAEVANTNRDISWHFVTIHHLTRVGVEGLAWKLPACLLKQLYIRLNEDPTKRLDQFSSIFSLMTPLGFHVMLFWGDRRPP